MLKSTKHKKHHQKSKFHSKPSKLKKSALIPPTEQIPITSEHETPQDPPETTQRTLPFFEESVLIAYKSKKYTECIKIIERILKVTPKDHANHYKILLAAANTMIGKKFKRSHNLLNEVLASNPFDAYALYGKGVAFYFEGKFDESMKYFDRAIEVDEKGMESAKDMKIRAEVESRQVRIMLEKIKIEFGQKSDDEGDGKNEDFGTKSDNFGTKGDNFGTKNDNFGTKYDNFGTKCDNFGTKGDNFGTKYDTFGAKNDSFGTQSDKFEESSMNSENFDETKSFSQNKEENPTKNSEKFSQNGGSSENFGKNSENFGKKSKKSLDQKTETDDVNFQILEEKTPKSLKSGKRRSKPVQKSASGTKNGSNFGNSGKNEKNFGISGKNDETENFVENSPNFNKKSPKSVNNQSKIDEYPENIGTKPNRRSLRSTKPVQLATPKPENSKNFPENNDKTTQNSQNFLAKKFSTESLKQFSSNPALNPESSSEDDSADLRPTSSANSFAQIKFNKALDLYMLGELQRSLKYFQKSLKLEPDFEEADEMGTKAQEFIELMDVVEINMSEKNYAAVVEICTEGLDIDEGNDAVNRKILFYRGLAYFHLGENDKSLEDYEEYERLGRKLEKIEEEK